MFGDQFWTLVSDEKSELPSKKHLYIKIFLCKYAYMRTTIDLPDPLFREVKTRAVQQGMKLKDLVAVYISTGLLDQSLPSSNLPPRRHCPLPIARKADGSVSPSLTNAQLQKILDEEDLVQYRG